MAPFRPSTRAMPSPSETTVPTSRTSSDAVYEASCRLRASLMLLAVMSATYAPPPGLVASARRTPSSCDATLPSRTRPATLITMPPTIERVHVLAQRDRTAERGGELVCQRRAQRVVERHRGRDVGCDDPALAPPRPRRRGGRRRREARPCRAPPSSVTIASASGVTCSPKMSRRMARFASTGTEVSVSASRSSQLAAHRGDDGRHRASVASTEPASEASSNSVRAYAAASLLGIEASHLCDVLLDERLVVVRRQRHGR